MAKAIKKPAAVIAAEELATSKAAELAAANDAVRRLEGEHAQALLAVRSAQEAADAGLPQCRMVTVRRYSGTDSEMGRAVILRKTPGGMLVVRRVGDTSGIEYKFKWAEYSNKFRQAEREWAYGHDRRELRDVPAEYVPEHETEED